MKRFISARPLLSLFFGLVIALGALSIAASLRPDSSQNVSSAIEARIATGVTPTDSTHNNDTLIHAADARERTLATMYIRNLAFGDSVKFQQYCSAGDKWRDMLVTWPNTQPTTLSSKRPLGFDTSAVWLSRTGTSLTEFVTASLDLVTDGDVRICRGVNDTGTVLIRRTLRQ